MRRATQLVLSGVFIAVAITGWAVSSRGAAHLFLTAATTTEHTEPALPAPVTFREEEGRGLLVKAWLNGRGPFTFAIDTGAGMTLLSRATATRAGLAQRGSTVVTGLSGRTVVVGRAVLDRLALGWSGNAISKQVGVVIAPQLPAGVDGILDPTETFSPFGYVIDYPAKLISAFDSRTSPLSAERPPAEGAIVRWYRDGHTSRPFVKLGDGRLALVDTGSDFGFAISQSRLGARDRTPRGASDIGGGNVRATRVAPTTINIGSLVLTDVPTDVLDGVERGVPAILGRDALYPFRLTFDPIQRLIEIAPSNVADRE